MSISNTQFKMICRDVLRELRGLAPYDTGNLALNAIKMEMPSPNVCLIYVDESIAPYMRYTTGAWLSPRWNGKKNPNEGWWQDACAQIAERVAKKINGTIEGR